MTENDLQFKKKMLVDLLDREIDQFAVEQKKHGWTSRALLVGIATIIWLFANQAPFASASPRNVGLLFFVFILTLDFASSCPSVLAARLGNLPREPRFALTSASFGFVRLSLLIRLIFYPVLFYISLVSKLPVMPVFRIIVQVILCFYMLLAILGLILSFLKIPISRFQANKVSGALSVFIILLTAVPLAGYYSALIKNAQMFSTADLKLAVLATLFTSILVLMIDLPTTSSPILSSLISIRRDLVLDRADVTWAGKQTDIALSGLQVGDLLQENIKEILDYYEIINGLLNKLSRTMGAIQAQIPNEPSDLRKDEYSSNLDAIDALGAVFKVDADSLDFVQGKLKASIERFRKKSNQIAALDKRSMREIEEVIRLIQNAQEESDKVNSAEKEQGKLLQTKLTAIRELPASR